MIDIKKKHEKIRQMNMFYKTMFFGMLILICVVGTSHANPIIGDDITISGYFNGMINASNVMNLDVANNSYDYLVWIDGSTIYAVNGSTGAIDYSGTNASEIIQSAIGTGNKKVHIKSGTYTLPSPITIYSGTTIEGDGLQFNTILKTDTFIEGVKLNGKSISWGIENIHFSGMCVNLSQNVSTWSTNSYISNVLIDVSLGSYPTTLNLDGNEDVTVTGLVVYYGRVQWQTPHGNVRMYSGFLEGGANVSGQTISFVDVTFTQPLIIVGTSNGNSVFLANTYWNSPTILNKHNVQNYATHKVNLNVVGGYWNLGAGGSYFDGGTNGFNLNVVGLQPHANGTFSTSANRVIAPLSTNYNDAGIGTYYENTYGGHVQSYNYTSSTYLPLVTDSSRFGVWINGVEKFNVGTGGTIDVGTWQATPIADGYIASAATWDAKAPLASPTFTGVATSPAVNIALAASPNDRLKLYYSSGGYIHAYNEGTSTHLPLVLDGSEIHLRQGGATKFKIQSSGVPQFAGLSGTGNAYACLDEYGQLYRSASACT